MATQRPIHLNIEKLSLAFDSPASDKFPLEYNDSTGELVLHMNLPDQETALTMEGENREFLAYSIKEIELRFSEEFVKRLMNAIPHPPLN